jgi:hypothetical protein
LGSGEQTSPLASLEPLVGDWTLEALIGGQSLSGAHASFEWIEGGSFLIQRADAELPPETPPEFIAASPFPTLSIIGLDDAFGSYSVLYADRRGVRRVYEMSFDGRVWKQWRNAPGFHQRSEATLSDDGRTITGRWEKSSDGTDWELDFEYTYRRVG